MKPREQALDFPTTPVTPQDAAVLRRGFASPGIVRRNQLHSEALANLHIQRVTIVSAVADQTFGRFGQEASFDGGFNSFVS